MTTHDAADSQARWASNGKRFCFLSRRSGSSQLWRITVDGGEAWQITRLPLDMDALAVSPSGSHLVIAMSVFPGRSREETKAKLDAKERAKAAGMLFARLMVRHWDTWLDGRHNHLFALDLTSGGLMDLTVAMDADCPTRPFGGAEDFDISPDGRTVVFSAKDASCSEACSTNFDLYAVAIDGCSAPVQLTSNPAWDAAPLFSPAGKKLAYLAMRRAGYEADRFDIVLRDWATGTERKITVRADDSPRGNRSAGELAWSADGKKLFCTADHFGQRAIFAVDVASGASRTVVAEGTCPAPQPAAGRLERNSMDTARKIRGRVEA